MILLPLRLLRKLAASDDRRYIALYFDLPETKSDTSDDMSQSNVSKWVHLLRGALNYVLSPHNLLPVRTADELARRLKEEPSYEEPLHGELPPSTDAPPFYP
jgi:transposase, IS4 family